MAKISLEEYKRTYRLIRIDEERRGFKVHFVVYVLINILLLLINVMFVPQFMWFIFPIIGWGIGVIMHYTFGVRTLENGIKSREVRVETKVKEKKKK